MVFLGVVTWILMLGIGFVMVCWTGSVTFGVRLSVVSCSVLSVYSGITNGKIQF